jgi:exonuclease SbcD
MIKLLHFADAHIDISSQGKRDPETGLPVRVLDFLSALDTIVENAISQKVDLVIFAGDAYKDRTPAPTYVREWEKRIIRLSRAGIPTLLLVGNHDISPAAGRANTLHDFDTLQVPLVKVINQPSFLKSDDLWGLPVQVIGIPYITRSALASSGLVKNGDAGQLYEEMEARIKELLDNWLSKRDEILPTILTAHASIQGAVYGQERSVILGNDLTLSGSLVKDPRLDYVAMGHIHKAQDVNLGQHPPVVYSGSIEKVDFGEIRDEKYYVIATVEKGKTDYTFHPLHGRQFIDIKVGFPQSASMPDVTEFMGRITEAMPKKENFRNAIVRVTVEYPRDWETLLDEPALREITKDAFEFHLIKHPQREASVRLPPGKNLASMSSMELLDVYIKTVKINESDAEEIRILANSIYSSSEVRELE